MSSNERKNLLTLLSLEHRLCDSWEHIINKRHKRGQMSSLYFWLILHSISAVAEELFWAEWQFRKYLSKIFFFTCLGGLVVECKASYLKIPGSNPIIFP